MNYEQLYKIGNSYEYKGEKLTIVDTRLTKTGRISARISSTNNIQEDFWTRAANPKTTLDCFYISNNRQSTEVWGIKNIKIK